MQPMEWNTAKIKECEQAGGQGLLRDERSLTFFGEDFGRLTQQIPTVVAVPSNTEKLQQIVRYANQKKLPLTIRGNGLSQGGQALCIPGGMVLQLQELNRVLEKNENSIWAEANATWSDVIKKSLKSAQVPYVVPYNAHLSIGGVLSAGGVGASSFRFGSATAHVNALEIVTANGEIQIVDKDSPLFQACLGGQGRFGIITKAEISLRLCKKQVRTFFLLYLDKDHWLKDMQALQESIDYLEFFCTPAIQGARLTAKGRLPFAEWLFGLHIAVEYDNEPPTLESLGVRISPWKVTHIQEEDIASFLHRHDSRFQSMKLSGQWSLQHPWFECFVPADVLFSELEDLLASLPVYYATVLQIVPIRKLDPSGFFMLPESSEAIYAVMILNPGLPAFLIPGCLEAIQMLDRRFLPSGGKRYLSGYLGENLPACYWQQHFGEKYQDWIKLKEELDPNKIFCSHLHK
ncbi:cytokinin oxidase [Legionella birminghamensis]|uniref:Cytokinin oxidase n=1 Tax=Legionella birminghamensis TaxID=28083 RepID=A0A378II64_9GAMM|nr:FAD-binding protein [Legionella birminghamensis]KTC75175.1 cytokinin oxidase [Legionella birminghamensis]STX31874.1 cytokinin oxidase [Legionella birminghamensis]